MATRLNTLTAARQGAQKLADAADSDLKNARRSARGALSALSELSGDYAAAIGVTEAALGQSGEWGWIETTYPSEDQYALLSRQAAELPQVQDRRDILRGLHLCEREIALRLRLLPPAWRELVETWTPIR